MYIHPGAPVFYTGKLTGWVRINAGNSIVVKRWGARGRGGGSCHEITKHRYY